MVARTFDSNMTDAMLTRLARHQVASFDNRKVIDELVAKRVPATFFQCGANVERLPAVSREVHAVKYFVRRLGFFWKIIRRHGFGGVENELGFHGTFFQAVVAVSGRVQV